MKSRCPHTQRAAVLGFSFKICSAPGLPRVESNLPHAETQTCLFFSPKQNLWKVKPNTLTAVETLIAAAASCLMVELNTTETTSESGGSMMPLNISDGH